MSTYSNVSFNEFGDQKTRYKDLIDTAAGYAEEKPHAVAKAVYVAIDCLDEANLIPESQKETYENVSYSAKLVKLSKAPGDLLVNLNSLRNKTADVITDGYSAGGMYGLVHAANSLIGPITDIADFFTKAILYIPSKSIAGLKAVNACSMVFAFGFGERTVKAWKTLEKAELATATGEKRNKEFTKFAGALIILAEQVSYLAIGVLSVLSLIFAVQIASTVFLTLSAATVALSILGYYYENLGTEIKTN